MWCYVESIFTFLSRVSERWRHIFNTAHSSRVPNVSAANQLVRAAAAAVGLIALKASESVQSPIPSPQRVLDTRRVFGQP